MPIGAHLNLNSSSLSDCLAEFKLLKDAGGQIAQILLDSELSNGSSSNSSSSIKNIKNIKNIKKAAKKYNINIIIHSSYMYNFANSWDIYSWWVVSLIQDMKTADMLNAKYIVLHLGKQLTLDSSTASNNMYTGLTYVLNQTKMCHVVLLLETSSGQGTEMYYKLEDLAVFYKKISDKFKHRVNLCLDTCHLFSAGYDLRDKSSIKSFLKLFNSLINIKHIKLIHMNDSSTQIGSKKDRHANIGSGYIGLVGLKYIYKIFTKLNINIILETPDNGFIKEIDMLIM